MKIMENMLETVRDVKASIVINNHNYARFLSQSIESAEFEKRCIDELGYAPQHILGRTLPFDLEFRPTLDSLQGFGPQARFAARSACLLQRPQAPVVELLIPAADGLPVDALATGDLRLRDSLP